MADRAAVTHQQIGRHAVPVSERFFAKLKSREFSYLLMLYPLTWVMFPALMYATFVPYIAVMLINLNTKFTLPVHLPITARKYYPLDENNKRPSRDKKGNSVRVAIPPAGQVYMGNVQGTDEQVWFDKPLTCTHLIFFATTGGGKTFSFTGLLANFIICSGFCYTDAKADLGLVENFSRMIFRQGRINCLYILSFQQGNRSPWMIAKSERISHSMNPCASASAPLIAEVFKSLLDGEGDIWAKRADNLSNVLIRPITYMRDKFDYPMGFGVIASYFTLERLGYLCRIGSNMEEMHPLPESDKKYFKPLIDFISTLPGMTDAMHQALVQQNKQAMAKITGQVRDQLGFITMQLVNVTNDLVGDYSHIFETAYGQLDLEDSMINRRFVLGLLPAMERSDSSMANLGKIVLALQKAIVANAMPFRISGNLSEHNASRPTNADYPFVSVNDEAGSFLTQGISTTTAQSRSSNVSFWFGGQDIMAMKKRGNVIEKEVDTIIGTTVNKLAGSVLDTNTSDLFIKYAHKELRLEATEQGRSYQGGVEQRDETRLTVQERDRLTPQILQEQAEGQAQLITKSKLTPITLPNYTTKDLSKPLVNFVMFETLPVKPMPPKLLAVNTVLSERYMTAFEGRQDLFASTRTQNAKYLEGLAKNVLQVVDSAEHETSAPHLKLSLATHAVLASTIFTRTTHLKRVNAVLEEFDMVSEHDCELINKIWPTDFAAEQDTFMKRSSEDEASSAAQRLGSISDAIEQIDDNAGPDDGNIEDITLEQIQDDVISMFPERTPSQTGASQREEIESGKVEQGQVPAQSDSWDEGGLFASFLGPDSGQSVSDGDSDEGGDSTSGGTGSIVPKIDLDAAEIPRVEDNEQMLPLSLPSESLVALNERLYSKGISRIKIDDPYADETEEAAADNPASRKDAIESELDALNALEAYRPDYTASKATAIDVLQRLTDSVTPKR